ncbi:MAG: BON domain-containing protein [Pyrinomonadaceae bacterium]|nr:BON domain-containing protein [Pyrinomonadaceae bacterium]
MRIIKGFLILTIAILGFSYSEVSAKNFSSDETQSIERQIGKKIRGLPYYGVFDFISYQVNDGTVILSGKVNNAINRKSAESVVKKIDGVSEVVNNIEILPPSRFDNVIRARTVRTFLRTGGIYRYLQGPNPSMRIIVDNGHITLEGYVRTKGDSRIANILASSVPGVFSVTNNLVATKEKISY